MRAFLVFSFLFVACGSDHPVVMDLGGALDASGATATDLASPIASCGTCTGCCTALGECTSGSLEKKCGAPGTICDDCTAKGAGYYCQYGDTKGFRCTQPQPNGSACVDNADCGSQHCNDHHVCDTLCTNIGAACITGNAVCCDAPSAACRTVGNDPNVQCCFVFGAVVDQAGCASCCDRFAPGFRCTKDDKNLYHCGS